MLKGKQFLGSQFSVADVYLNVMLDWGSHVGATVPAELLAYAQGIQARPGVGSTHAAIAA